MERLLRSSYFALVVIVCVIMTSCMSGSDEVVTDNGTLVLTSFVNECEKSPNIILKSTFGVDSENDTVFRIMENTGITAEFNFMPDSSNPQSDLWHIDWLDAEGELVYRKKVKNASGDTITDVSSYITTEPATRLPGRYSVEFYHFRERIARKFFTLEPAFDAEAHRDEIQSSIILYRGVSRKTGKRVGEGTSFNLHKKRKVRALVKIENNLSGISGPLLLNVCWRDPDGNVFYNKVFHTSPQEERIELKSYITIEPGSRDPGRYTVEVDLFGVKIREQHFVVE